MFEFLRNLLIDIRNRVNQSSKGYIFVGFFFLFLQSVIIYTNYNVNDFDVFFWFCNHIPLAFAIAFFIGRVDVIKSFINVGFLIQFLWGIDFLSKLFFDFYIFNVTSYVFESSNFIGFILPVLVHLFSTNVALLLTYDKKPTKKVLFYSLIYVIILYIFTLNFTNPAFNINCVYQMCGIEQYTFSNYTNWWILITFVVVVLPTQLLQYGLYKLSKK